MPSPLFLPFRALGYITDEVPFATQKRGRETFVTVSVGKSWQVYDCAKLLLKLVGPPLPHRISALACKRDLTFAAVGKSIAVCQRVHRLADLQGHTGSSLQLLVLGERLLSLGEDHTVVVWNISALEEAETFQRSARRHSFCLPNACISISAEMFHPSKLLQTPVTSYRENCVTLDLGQRFEATCMAHPDTYLNKIVVGSSSGKMQLWNFSSGQMLYEFQLASCAVCCIVPSPALDVVAVGLADGRAVLHNLRFDEQVASFANAAGLGADVLSMLPADKSKPGKAGGRGGACTAISFLTGNSQPLMAAGGASGAITVWDLEAKRLQTIIRDAHDAPLTTLFFFPGEPRLMSSACDNSLKQWVFDSADGAGRLLRFRGGHAAPPTVVRYYGAESRSLLSGGQDRAFRLFSTIQDQQSQELSQRHIKRRAKRLRIDASDLKLPQLTGLDASQARETDWCNVVTAHQNDPAAYTWRLQHFALGDHVLRPPKDPLAESEEPPAPVSAVAMSRCGNFAVVGSHAGRLDRYNMQSGLHRGTYCRVSPGPPPIPSSAHDGAISGVAVEASNRALISAGLDAKLRVWDFRTQALERQIELPAAASHLAHHYGSDLVAVACDDLVLYMYDVMAGRMVRRFRGHTDRVTDMLISEDAAWLVSASMDGTLRVHDIAAARPLQVLRLGPPITGLTLAANKELLATTHTNRRGIYLWSNQLIFGSDTDDILHSVLPVEAALPELAAERQFEDELNMVDETEAAIGLNAQHDSIAASLQLAVAPLSSDSEQSTDFFYDADKNLLSHQDGPAQEAMQSKIDQIEDAEYRRRQWEPIAPELVMLSMLPASQVQSLMHLDSIKARSKPVEPPKQPAAAPFFLPTIPSLAGQPQFGENDATGDIDAESSPPTQSRVTKGAAHAMPLGSFVQALRAQDGFEAAMQVLAELSPLEIDRQLRDMQVVEGSSKRLIREQLNDIALVLDLMSAGMASGQKFDLLQGVLTLVLQVHGSTIRCSSRLRLHAGALQSAIKRVWSQRLNPLLQGSQCMLGFLSGTVQ